MKVESTTCLFFSPTGTTRTIVENIAKGMLIEKIDLFDCTNLSQRKSTTHLPDNDITIIATPVYYGRVPEVVVPFLQTLSAQKKPVVLVVVYGNREYDDALLELRDISAQQGFIPVAGGAFIAEHSYSTSSRPIAHTRPDQNDIEKAILFGSEIKQKLQSIDILEDLAQIDIPGNFPYLEPKNLHMIKEARNTLSFTPETDPEKCTQCNLCSKVCPTEAISFNDITKIDKWQCIICFACIKNCPSGAKQMLDPHFNGAIEPLQMACQERKEPEMYL